MTRLEIYMAKYIFRRNGFAGPVMDENRAAAFHRGQTVNAVLPQSDIRLKAEQ